jgi:catechol 2,3-dioxygenase-like lactoylglutathione lyase family enzyme
MIIGAHIICYTRDAEADRRFVRDVFGFPHVDAGQGWLIFALPPAEVAFHPGEESDGQELYLLCDDLDATLATLGKHAVPFTPPTEARWGRVTRLTLPGGSQLGLYQPYHPLAIELQGRPPGWRPPA